MKWLLISVLTLVSLTVGMTTLKHHSSTAPKSASTSTSVKKKPVPDLTPSEVPTPTFAQQYNEAREAGAAAKQVAPAPIADGSDAEHPDGGDPSWYEDTPITRFIDAAADQKAAEMEEAHWGTVDRFRGILPPYHHDKREMIPVMPLARAKFRLEAVNDQVERKEAACITAKATGVRLEKAQEDLEFAYQARDYARAVVARVSKTEAE